MPLDYYISRYMVYTVHIHTSIYLSSVLMLIECVGIYQARFITSRFAVLFSLCPSLAHTSVPLFFSIAFRMVLCGGAHSTWCGLCILKHAIYHPNREENNNTICTSHSSSGFVCCGCVYGWMVGFVGSCACTHSRWKGIYTILCGWISYVYRVSAALCAGF